MAGTNIKFVAVVRSNDLTVTMTKAAGDQAANHHAMLEKVLTSGGLAKVAPGSRHTLEEQSQGVKFHFMIDDTNAYVLVVITDFEYPVRLAFDLLQKQLLGKIKVSYADKVASAKANGLSKTCSKMLSDLMQQYEDVRNVDKLAAVQAQVDDVKGTMAANIATVVKNTEALEDMDEKAVSLANNAKLFNDQASILRRKMWWQNCKMKLVMGLIVATGLTVLGVIIWQSTKSDDRRRLGGGRGLGGGGASMLRGMGER